MNYGKAIKPVTRLNTTLPEPLAVFVGQITGEGGLYETPTEFVRDLIRRYMEQAQKAESIQINSLLAQSIAENNYSAWTQDDMQEIMDKIEE